MSVVTINRLLLIDLIPKHQYFCFTLKGIKDVLSRYATKNTAKSLNVSMLFTLVIHFIVSLL